MGILERLIAELAAPARAGHRSGSCSWPPWASGRSCTSPSTPFPTSPTSRSRCWRRPRACRRPRWSASSPIRSRPPCAGLPRLSQVRSVSKSGLSVVTVIFEDGVDVYFARQRVLERLIEARGAGPRTTSRSPWGRSRRPWARSTSIRSKARGRARRRTRRRLPDPSADGPGLDDAPRCSSPIPGVNEVNSFGGYIKQYHVDVDPEKLLAYDLTLGRDRRFAAPQQPQRRRQHPRARRKAVPRPRHRAAADGRGHRRRRPEDGPTARRSCCATSPTSHDGQAVRQGGAVQDGKGEVVGGVVMMLRGANGREVVQRGRAPGRRDQRLGRPAGRPAHRALLQPHARSSSRAVSTVTEALLYRLAPGRCSSSTCSCAASAGRSSSSWPCRSRPSSPSS